MIVQRLQMPQGSCFWALTGENLPVPPLPKLMVMLVVPVPPPPLTVKVVATTAVGADAFAGVNEVTTV